MMLDMLAWGRERGIEKGLDRVVQFERVGFVRIDDVSGDGVVAYFTHR